MLAKLKILSVAFIEVFIVLADLPVLMAELLPSGQQVSSIIGGGYFV